MSLAKSTAESFYQKGDKAHDQRDFPFAEKLLRAALALDPGHWKARYTLAVLLQDLVLNGDHIHFSGGNTFLEAFAAGNPVLTMQGRPMRGRFTAGFYRAMGLADRVADSPAAYVALAIRLGRDAEFRNEMARQIAQRSDVLFEDARVIEHWSDFLGSVQHAG